MSAGSIRELQRALNRFTKTFLGGVAPLHIDGKWGPATEKRIRIAKHYLGYRTPTIRVNHTFLLRLRHPKDSRYSTPARIARGIKRRIAQRRRWRKNVKAAHRRTGVVMYDGRPCAAWIARYLDWARHTGHNGRRWHGTLTSGWRDPDYSESLCLDMCGAPSCPGRCAGKSSNHSGQVEPQGAADVTDYVTFGELMQHCPLEPKLVNHLPIDPVHYSASGR